MKLLGLICRYDAFFSPPSLPPFLLSLFVVNMKNSKIRSDYRGEGGVQTQMTETLIEVAWEASPQI